MFRILGTDGLLPRVNIYDYAVNFFLENRTGKITLNIYLVSVTEILHPCSNHGKGALLISSGYVPRIIRGKKCLYLFDSYSEDGEVNISHNSKVFIIFDPFSNFDLRST